jgi:phosphatidylserine/phosphatidylglycerophosphate/cardiolipin synthase-like enzyme
MRARIAAVFLLLAACAPAQPTLIASTETAGSIEIYFTDSDAPDARRVRGGPDEELADALDAARVSIDMAIYDLDLWSIRDALLAAAERGVQVRMVVEADNAGNAELSELAAAGIPIVADTSPNFMHSKFVIIDHYEVWSGSANFTVGDMYGNRNNLIAIQSSSLAENYTVEFDEMFADGLFGDASRADTPRTQVEIGGIEVENYFSPDDGVLDRLVALVNGAQESVRFLAFSFTSSELADALAAAQARGVSVAGVMDEGQLNNTGGRFDFFRQAGIDVRVDPEGSNLHDKVIIIDGNIVVTGSYNFSNNAEFRNDENTLIIHNAGIAKQYLQQFDLVWSLTQP